MCRSETRPCAVWRGGGPRRKTRHPCLEAACTQPSGGASLPNDRNRASVDSCVTSVRDLPQSVAGNSDLSCELGWLEPFPQVVEDSELQRARSAYAPQEMPRSRCSLSACMSFRTVLKNNGLALAIKRERWQAFRSVPSGHHIGRCPPLQDTRARDKPSFGSSFCRERNFSHPYRAYWNIKDMKFRRDAAAESILWRDTYSASDIPTRKFLQKRPLLRTCCIP